MNYQKFIAVDLSTDFLAACGGGGGSSSAPVATGPVASATSFSLQSSYKSDAASGYTKSFTISGSCSGYGNYSVSPANTPATFEGVNGFSSISTITETSTNCTLDPAQSSTSYYDTNYVPLGSNTVGVSYGVFLTPPVIPATVKVGDTGTIGTLTRYKDSTKTTPDGKSVSSYVIEPDTANTAIVNLISKRYNAGGTLTLTEQDRYRISSTNTFTPISMDVQYANGSTTHLVYTFN